MGKWKTIMLGKARQSEDSRRKLEGNSRFMAAALELYTRMLSGGG